eukprot:2204458-Pleurochrysis_carterae.AAC.1
MLNAYMAMDAAYARNLITLQQIVQLDFFAPATSSTSVAAAARTYISSTCRQVFTSKDVVEEV